MKSKPLVLCIDDDHNILESMQLNLRREYKVLTAASGPLGFELLKENAEVAVVLSDMRMPEMDGATFLAEVKKRHPDVVRMLLTGYSDIDSAMRAVNEGQIFRFLAKPCAPDHLKATMAAAVEQHRLLTAEKVLLQKTLLGSVKAMIEVLALANPLALGRAVRTRDLARKVAASMQLEPRWPLEFAALLSQLGTVSLAEETLQKIYCGDTLDESELKRLIGSMGAVNKILSNIPRLEPVTKVLQGLRKLIADSSSATDEQSQLLFAILEVDKGESRGLSLREAIDSVLKNCPGVTDDISTALEALLEASNTTVRKNVPASGLREGMLLADDLKNRSGVVILPRGFEINQSSLEHIANFADELQEESVDVLTLADATDEPQEVALASSK